MSNFKIREAWPYRPLPSPMNMGRYLLGVERVKRFVNVHLHGVASNLKS